jgi:hypothetical protein
MYTVLHLHSFVLTRFEQVVIGDDSPSLDDQSSYVLYPNCLKLNSGHKIQQINNILGPFRRFLG